MLINMYQIKMSLHLITLLTTITLILRSACQYLLAGLSWSSVEVHWKLRKEHYLGLQLQFSD
jgi:hypothetical protein